jgi:hypothetical protein
VRTIFAALISTCCLFTAASNTVLADYAGQHRLVVEGTQLAASGRTITIPWESGEGGTLRIVVATSKSSGGIYDIYVTHFIKSGYDIVEATLSVDKPCVNVKCPATLYLDKILDGLLPTAGQSAKTFGTAEAVLGILDPKKPVSFHWKLTIKEDFEPDPHAIHDGDHA